MRKDQIERLNDLSERVAEQFILDADPDNWAGTGKTAADMDTAERGDAVWCRKLAVQTGALLARVRDLAEREKAGADPGTGDEVEAEIKQYERKAKDILSVVAKRAARAG